MPTVVVPLLIFVACFCVGAASSARWLPDLAVGAIGGAAFLLVCGLIGAALSLIGLHIYSIEREIHHLGGSNVISSGEVFATGIVSMLYEVSAVLGFAFVVYLLAPKLTRATTPS
ncbi:MAG TPA: hypothetical protein VFR48_11310 [Solirubrobacteraceae bacterium]|nr:hypothetical protein [Solirubrobacteraceae bacterium]